MRRVVGHSARVAMICLGMSLPLEAVAQSAAHDYIRTNWNSFVEFCKAFVEDPTKVRDGLVVTEKTAEYSKTVDGSGLYYAEELQPGDVTKEIVIDQFQNHIDAHCTITGFGHDQRIEAHVLASALTDMISATPQLSLNGGEVVDQILDERQDGYEFYLDGAFPGLDAFIFVSIDDAFLGLEVHFDYPLSGRVN